MRVLCSPGYSWSATYKINVPKEITIVCPPTVSQARAYPRKQYVHSRGYSCLSRLKPRIEASVRITVERVFRDAAEINPALGITPAELL